MNGNLQQSSAVEMMRSLPALADGVNGAGNEDVTTLLKEIRDEIRQNNEALKNIQTQSTSIAPAMAGPPEDRNLV